MEPCPFGSLAKANAITITKAQIMIKIAGMQGMQQRHGLYGSGGSGRLRGILARVGIAVIVWRVRAAFGV
jgi:hypothetical protein